MNHSLKMKLRKIKEKSRFMNIIYLYASRVKMKRLQKLSDEDFLKRKYKENTGKDLNIDNPITFNEKLQWLKLYNRKPEYTNMVDKYEAKKYVAQKIGEEHIIPIFGVWDSFDDIDFDSLPNQFVLKCNHDCGSIVICKDKSTFSKKDARKILERALNKNYFWQGREWPYKNVKPKILAEKFMVDESGCDLKDYKFFCFNGEPKAMFVASDRMDANQETKFDFYDMNFIHLPITNGHPNAQKQIEKPTSFEKMKEFARILSKDIPFVRVDFYDINGQIYFGELTLFHWGGTMPFEPEEWDTTFGSWITLPEKTVND